MKNKIFFLFVWLLLSCNKQETIINNENSEPEEVDTTSWRDAYEYNGVLPNNLTTNSNISGTKWVLYKVMSGYSVSYPNDTIKFTTNNAYVLNQNGQRPYNLSQITGSTNKSLTLYYFLPFGGGTYSGQVGQYFNEDGYMNNIEFTNLQNNTLKIVGWFKKI